MLLKDKRVFIVEDNAGNLAIASIYLEQQGAAVKFARWGEEALQLMQRNLPLDVILLDLMLPGRVSGFDVFAMLKQEPTLSGIPIVAVSASDPDIAIPKTMSVGFAGFIAKPISPKIVGYIEEVLNGKDIWIAEGGGF